MKFQTRLLIRYSFLVVFLVLVLSVSFYSYTARLFEDNAAGTYRLLSSRMSLHLDNLIRPMDFITENLISDYSFRSALTTLSAINRADPRNDQLVNEADQTITSGLLTYSIQKNFYSVVVVTKGGDFFSSNFLKHGQIKSEVEPLSEVPGYEAAKGAGGRVVLVPPHDDPWDQVQKVSVYGIARVVLGLPGDLAFMEVQNPVRDLDALFRVPDQAYVRILAVQSDGSPFYESNRMSSSLVSHYFDLANRSSTTDGFRWDSLTGKSELIIAAKSVYTGITIILILSRDVLLAPLTFVGWSTAGMSLLLILLSIAYNWLSSAQLTKPLRTIRQRMEAIELSNLPGHEALEHDNDEIVALDQSFQRLRTRLDDAIRRELDYRTTSLQSRLDSLQAQVNPHFLYNILTVIAGKGLELGNEEIGEICDAIAGMLRYSTSTAIRSASVAEEIEHTRAYLFLMKKRLEERLHFSFDVDEELLPARIPKIVLQQLVENAVTHGYRDADTPLDVSIRGYREGERWIIEVTDDGRGFDSSVLEDIRSRIGVLSDRSNGKDENSGLEIGGLGLLNTYIRLHLFFNGDFVWDMRNVPGGGACVTIGAPLRVDVLEDTNAHDSAG